MKLRPVTKILLTMFLASMLSMAFDVACAANELRVHNIDTGRDYETIQEAINADETYDGHTIQVEAGIYSEHVNVDKSLKLVGEDRSTTIIDAGGTGTVVVITADNVHISGFTLRNSGSTPDDKGVSLDRSSSTIISGNIIANNTLGIWLENVADSVIGQNTIKNHTFGGIYLGDSANNSISRNTLRNNPLFGMWLERSDNNTIIENTVKENGMGISLEIESNNNTVSSNTIKDNYEGIHLSSSFNDFCENTITSNWYGIFSLHSGDNIIYHNNFIENIIQTSLTESYVDLWDNGCEGNYWSDYNGTDTNQDGIGETPYTIREDIKDDYPLMGMFSNFTISWQEQDYSLTAICNSTISDFQFNASLRRISFDVTGETGIGFCRVTIPNVLIQDLWQENYTVLFNGEPWPFENWIDNENTYLYFTYPHSEHEVVIVPEFPSALILPLLVIVTVVAVVLSTRKKRPIIISNTTCRPCARGSQAR